MRRFLISTTYDLWETLRNEAQYRGQTLSGLIREILMEWTEREKGIKTTNKTD